VDDFNKKDSKEMSSLLAGLKRANCVWPAMEVRNSPLVTLGPAGNDDLPICSLFQILIVAELLKQKMYSYR
jgi:hypothetical protein